MPARMVAGILGLTLGVAGVLPSQAAATSPEADKDATSAITTLIGDAACDTDSQCRTIAMGAKACGGPEYYLAWSTKRTDAAALAQAAQRDLASPRNPNAGPRGYSTCVFVTDPGAWCAPASGQARDAAGTQGQACQLRGGNRGGQGRVD